MSLVGSRLALVYRCTIERDAAEADSWGTPGPPDWQAHLIDLPCRVWVDAGREVVANTTTVAVVEDVRLIVPAGTDVKEADRVASVTYRGGTAQDGPLQVRAVLARRDHLELVLVKVK